MSYKSRGNGITSRLAAERSRLAAERSRCSNRESEAADALSKCEFARAFENMDNREKEAMDISKVILQWAKDPTPTGTLGRQILKEISKKYPNLRVRDWRAWEEM